MIHVYICEDEEAHQTFLKKSIQNYNLFHNDCLQLKKIFSSSHALEQYLPSIQISDQITVFLLDVELQGAASGIALGKRIKDVFPDAYIIFVTNHRDLCYLTFELQLDTFDYIIKDTNSFANRFTACMDKLISTIDSRPLKDARYFTYQAGPSNNRILEEQIYYFTASASSHKVVLHTRHKTVEFYGTLKHISSTLSDQFIFCHKSYIVNKRHITQYDYENHKIVFDDGSSCPVSIRFQKSVRDMLT